MIAPDVQRREICCAGSEHSVFFGDAVCDRYRSIDDAVVDDVGRHIGVNRQRSRIAIGLRIRHRLTCADDALHFDGDRSEWLGHCADDRHCVASFAA